MLRILAILVGIIFIFLGVAGFLPELKQNNLLFGFLETGFLLDVIHIGIGVIGIMAATSFKSTKLFFQIFGIIFALVAMIGFFNQGNIYLVHINIADIIFYAITALIFLLLGFMVPKRRAL